MCYLHHRDDKVQVKSDGTMLNHSRQHLSYGDCLEDNGDDYQNCSVLYGLPQLYDYVHAHEQL